MELTLFRNGWHSGQGLGTSPDPGGSRPLGRGLGPGRPAPGHPGTGHGLGSRGSVPCPWPEAFVAGLGGGLRLCVLGLVPTPAVAHATATRPGAWGLMVSASHNPPEDNGIKGFDGKGEKLAEEDEAALEAEFEHPAGPAPAPAAAARPGAGDRGLHPPSGRPGPAGPDLALVVDCAHGATAPWAPRLIRGRRDPLAGRARRRRPDQRGGRLHPPGPTLTAQVRAAAAPPPASPSTATATAA